MKTGFAKFLENFNRYLDYRPDIASAKGCKIKVYGSVTLENLAVARAISKFYGKPWFSNVSVRMNIDELFDYASDNGVCYGQVTNSLDYLMVNVYMILFKLIIIFFKNFKILLITQIVMVEPKISLNLALIKWYDFKSQSNPYLYGCSRLKLTEIYNFIDIEAIQDVVHIIPRFDSNNDYLVNKFIF